MKNEQKDLYTYFVELYLKTKSILGKTLVQEVNSMHDY